MFNENEIMILINLVKSAEYMAKVTQADNDLRNELHELVKKLEEIPVRDDELTSQYFVLL